jgi:hypothetical protein
MNKIVCIVGIATTSLLMGCGQGAQDGDERPGKSSGALGTVDDCIAQVRSCAADASSAADGAACEQQLKTCLSTLLPDASAPPSFDAGLPSLPDAAVPPVPPLPDAGVVTIPDAGATVAGVQACIAALGACLSSSTDPTTCADQVRTCLQGI